MYAKPAENGCRMPRNESGTLGVVTPAIPQQQVAVGDLFGFGPRAVTKLYSIWVGLTYPFVSQGDKLSIHITTIVNRKVARRIKIGNSVQIRKDTWLNVPAEAGDGLKIVIDDQCVIGARTVISAKNLIHIERDVMFGTSVLVMDHNHAYEDIRVPIKNQGTTRGGIIRIEQGCWIGQGAAIVCNEGELVIGRNSVVGANSLITRSFPPYSVILGNPARLARKYDLVKNAWVGGGVGRSTGIEPAQSDILGRSAAWERNRSEGL
jgi:acetyltransferase-like isoleucine patch superfamily enzyme